MDIGKPSASLWDKQKPKTVFFSTGPGEKSHCARGLYFWPSHTVRVSVWTLCDRKSNPSHTVSVAVVVWAWMTLLYSADWLDTARGASEVVFKREEPFSTTGFGASFGTSAMPQVTLSTTFLGEVRPHRQTDTSQSWALSPLWRKRRAWVK